MASQGKAFRAQAAALPPLRSNQGIGPRYRSASGILHTMSLYVIICGMPSRTERQGPLRSEVLVHLRHHGIKAMCSLLQALVYLSRLSLSL